MHGASIGLRAAWLLTFATAGTLAGPASAAPPRPHAGSKRPGSYRLRYDTTHERFDRHTLATSSHRGSLQLTLAGGDAKAGSATLHLEDRWSYHSSSDHGDHGGPLYLVDRNVQSKVTWSGRWRALHGGVLALSLSVSTARCTARGRRGRRGAGRPIKCEGGQALALRCSPATERAYPAAGDRSGPSQVARRERRRAIAVLGCKPHGMALPKQLAPAALRVDTIALAPQTPLTLYRKRGSDGKTRTLLRR